MTLAKMAAMEAIVVLRGNQGPMDQGLLEMVGSGSLAGWKFFVTM